MLHWKDSVYARAVGVRFAAVEYFGFSMFIGGMCRFLLTLVYVSRQSLLSMLVYEFVRAMRLRSYESLVFPPSAHASPLRSYRGCFALWLRA